MSKFDNPMEEMGERLKRLIADHKKEEDCYNEVHELMKKDDDAVEKEVLMEFWSKVGNSPYTYYMALQAAHQFINALEGMRDIKGLPEDMHLLIIETLGKCAEVDAQCLRAIIETKAKHQIE